MARQGRGPTYGGLARQAVGRGAGASRPVQPGSVRHPTDVQVDPRERTGFSAPVPTRSNVAPGMPPPVGRGEPDPFADPRPQGYPGLPPVPPLPLYPRQPPPRGLPPAPPPPPGVMPPWAQPPPGILPVDPVQPPPIDLPALMRDPVALRTFLEQQMRQRGTTPAPGPAGRPVNIPGPPDYSSYWNRTGKPLQQEWSSDSSGGAQQVGSTGTGSSGGGYTSGDAGSDSPGLTAFLARFAPKTIPQRDEPGQKLALPSDRSGTYPGLTPEAAMGSIPRVVSGVETWLTQNAENKGVAALRSGWAALKVKLLEPGADVAGLLRGWYTANSTLLESLFAPVVPGTAGAHSAVSPYGEWGGPLTPPGAGGARYDDVMNNPDAQDAYPDQYRFYVGTDAHGNPVYSTKTW